MGVIPHVHAIRGGILRSDQPAIPMPEFLGALPPIARGVGTHGGTGAERQPSGGARLLAAEPWMIPFILPGTGGGHGPRGGRNPNPGEGGVEGIDEEDFPDDEEAAVMAVDVWGVMAEARLGCAFDDLHKCFRVVPLGGEDTLDRIGRVYDAYRGRVDVPFVFFLSSMDLRGRPLEYLREPG